MARTSRYSAKHLFIGAASTALLSLSVVPPGGADESPQAEKSEQRFDIPAQPLSEALAEFSRQSKSNVVAPSALTIGRTSAPVAGEMTPEAALSQLMRNTGLRIRPRGQGGFVVAQAVAEHPKPVRTQLAQAEVPVRTTEADERDVRDEEEEGALRQEKVTVTGTLIRGLAPESSPLQIYDRDSILASGIASTDQFIRTIPQNFSGGSTEFLRALPNDEGTALNITGGTGVNLRGLGAGSTLTLLNGRRLAVGSSIGDFVDVSLIPMSAIERIEVLTDGASSIYGGDAVAGVMNFVLREDFDGAETALRYGGVTEGDLREFRASQTLGRSWDSGNVLGVYEYFSRDELLLSDRPDITPTSQSGGGFTNSELFSLLPSRERHSALIGGRQEITDAWAVSGNGLYSNRSGDYNTLRTFGELTSDFQESEAYSLSFGTDYTLSNQWQISAEGAFSASSESRETIGVRLSTGATRYLATDISSDLWSIGVKADGDLFDLPGGRAKAAFGFDYREESFESGARGEPSSRIGQRDVRSVFAEVQLPLVGDGNAVPGIQRLELNVSGRVDQYSDFGGTANPKYGVVWVPADGLKLRSSYSTSFSPPPLGRIGALDRSGSVYNYGAVLQQFGVQPTDPSLVDMTLLRTFGTASADLDAQTATSFTAGVDFDKSFGDHTWSLSSSYYDVEYQGRLGRTPVPGNLATTNLAPNIAFVQPELFPDGSIIFNPTVQQVQAVIDTFNFPLQYFNGAVPGDPIDIINNVDQIRNLAETKTRGLDADLSYEYDAGVATYYAGFSANYILDFTQRASVTTPAVETLNTLFNPVDLKMTGRLGYTRGGFAGNMMVNYVDSYTVDSTSASQPIDSWTTVDASLAYRFEKAADWYGGASIRISALNLFNKMPPRTPTFGTQNIPGYDPTNASPLGRFVALEVSKQF